MNEHSYTPPTPAVETRPRLDGIDNEFFVVGTRKFLLLYVATLGMYPLYWFYRQWEQYRHFHKQNMRPVARAIFWIFYAHSLARRIDDRLRSDGAAHAWSPDILATVYIVLAFFDNAVNRIPEGYGLLVDALPLIVLAPSAWLLLKIQQAANLACGEPLGESNQRLTGANWAWLVLGGLFWLLIMLGLFMPEES